MATKVTCQSEERSQIVHAGVAIALAAALIMGGVVGCGPAAEARQSMRDGDAILAVEQYQQALARSPDDAELRAEFDQARRQAASELAEQAQLRVDAGQFGEAVQLAQQAAYYDPSYRDLEQQVRHAHAFHQLARAQSLLESREFAAARQATNAAEAVATDLTEPMHLRVEIAESEARYLHEQLPAMLNAGKFAEAQRVAARIKQLQPGREDLAQLPAEIEERARQAQFDEIATKLMEHLNASDLDQAAHYMPELMRLNVRHQQLDQLQRTLDERTVQFDAAVASARAARQAERYDVAVAAYNHALSIAQNRTELVAERQATQNLSEASNLRHAGHAALDNGNLQEAINALTASIKLNPDERTEDLLQQAQQALHVRAFQVSLAEDDLAAAINHGIALARIRPDSTLLDQIDQLREELAMRALSEASQLHADGLTNRALTVLEHAMHHVHDPRLNEWHAALRVEEIVQEAVSAEQQGRYGRARDLYLAALRIGGDRVDIQMRIDDSEVLAAMQADMEHAIQEANHLRRELAALDRQYRNRHQEVRRLVQTVDALHFDLQQLERNNQRAGQEIYALNQKIRRLQTQLHQAEVDRDNWRRRYQNASSNLPRRGRPRSE